MSEVKYPFRFASIYNDGKNNIQSNYSGINAAKDFNDFAERNKLKWAILLDEDSGKIVDSFNCQPERDTYRDLCAELLGAMRINREAMSLVLTDQPLEWDIKDSVMSAHDIATQSITKAESILGEKNGR